MPIEIQDLDGGITKVNLTGRIDVAGASQIDMPMSIVAGSRRAVVIDLSGCEFMASMGLRSLVLTAKSVASKKGRVVLLNPNANVESVIVTSGIDSLIPIFHDLDAAVLAVTQV